MCQRKNVQHKEFLKVKLALTGLLSLKYISLVKYSRNLRVEVIQIHRQDKIKVSKTKIHLIKSSILPTKTIQLNQKSWIWIPDLVAKSKVKKRKSIQTSLDKKSILRALNHHSMINNLMLPPNFPQWIP